MAFQLVFSFLGEDFFHANGMWEMLLNQFQYFLFSTADKTWNKCLFVLKVVVMYYLKGLPSMLSGQLLFLKCVCAYFHWYFNPKWKSSYYLLPKPSSSYLLPKLLPMMVMVKDGSSMASLYGANIKICCFLFFADVSGLFSLCFSRSIYNLVCLTPC